MWIERIEFTGFGSLVNQKIEFSKDKLNLVVESNEYGKSTIAEAIWAILFDYPANQRTTDSKLKEREARKPSSGAYKACLDLVCKGRKLRIVRDFGEKTLRVFDRQSGDKEVTGEFLVGANQDELGLKLVGMGRSQFKSTCFVGQRELDENALDGDSHLSSLLESVADSASGTTCATAISILEDTLSHLPYGGKKQRIDKIIRDLEDQQQSLAGQSRKLEGQRQAVSKDMDRLAELEQLLSDQDKQSYAQEYFRLCLEVADLDHRLIDAQQQMLQVGELQNQFVHVSAFENFPIDRLKDVEELWSKRKSKIEDRNRLRIDIEEKVRQTKTRDLEIRERWEGLSGFTTDEANAIGGIAHTLQNASSELKEAKQKRKVEFDRVSDSRVEIDKLEGIRKCLLNLEHKDVDNAYAYNAMIKSAREEITECEGSVWRARMISQEVEDQRKQHIATWQGRLQLMGIIFVLFLVAALATAFGPPTIKVFMTPAIGIAALFGVCLGAVVVWTVGAKTFRDGDLKKARDDEQNLATKGQEAHSKIMGLEVRLEELARKAGVVNGAQLIKYIEDYASAAPQLKDLDLLDQLISSRESNIIRFTGDLEKYFEKAKRPVDDISAESAMKLSLDIAHYLEETNALRPAVAVVENRQTELQFMSDELQVVDNTLRDIFQQAKLEHAGDIEKGYKEFSEGVEQHRKCDSIKADLKRMNQHTAVDSSLAFGVSGQVQTLQSKRDASWSRMGELISRYPEIADAAPPTVQPGIRGGGNDEFSLDESLRRESNELKVQVRAATKDYDENYMQVQVELETVATQLARLRETRSSLQLARDTFARLAGETHSHWASRLNEISKQLLESLKTDYESLHFDADLRLTARRKGHSEPLQPANIQSQLSTGTKEQIHWLARLAISRFLSTDKQLPIILDEPFSEADDDRFLQMMRFLMDSVVQQHQIILFSCHQGRHQWLVDQLDASQKDLVAFCELQPMK